MTAVAANRFLTQTAVSRLLHTKNELDGDAPIDLATKATATLTLEYTVATGVITLDLETTDPE